LQSEEIVFTELRGYHIANKTSLLKLQLNNSVLDAIRFYRKSDELPGPIKRYFEAVLKSFRKLISWHFTYELQTQAWYRTPIKLV